MKIDAQGFECMVLKGWGHDVASSIEIVKFEYATHWLMNLNCTNLVPRFMNYGFEVYSEYSGGRNFANPVQANPEGRVITDFFAVRKKTQMEIL